MKLIRFGSPDEEKPGIVKDGIRYDVSQYIPDYDEKFFAGNGIEKLRVIIDNPANKFPRVSETERLGPPVARPSKLICIGLNYSDHATESNMELPEEPVVFFKSTTAICGPDDDLIIPRNSVKTDWEVELAVVIGKKASYVDEGEALDHVAGYLLHNDYSEREFQLERAGQWVKGKSADTFAPLGPWLVTKEEIDDLDNLRLWLTVNDKTMQDGSTATLVFKVPYLIAYLSQFMTLLPGDVISTGTPAGVALGQKPVPIYLKPGDEIALGINGLGKSKQIAKAYVKS